MKTSTIKKENTLDEKNKTNALKSKIKFASNPGHLSEFLRGESSSVIKKLEVLEEIRIEYEHYYGD